MKLEYVLIYPRLRLCVSHIGILYECTCTVHLSTGEYVHTLHMYCTYGFVCRYVHSYAGVFWDLFIFNREWWTETKILFFTLILETFNFNFNFNFVAEVCGANLWIFPLICLIATDWRTCMVLDEI